MVSLAKNKTPIVVKSWANQGDLLQIAPCFGTTQKVLTCFHDLTKQV